MTLKELQTIKAALIRHCWKEGCILCRTYHKANEILDREIKLKTTDFVTSRIIGESNAD